MGKNNNKDIVDAIVGIGFIIVMLVLGAILFVVHLIPIIIPILFLIVAAVSHFLYVTKDKQWLDTGFWLTDYERSEFITHSRIFYRAIDTKSNIQDRINSGNVRLNVDGSISRRSYDGRDARAAFENANNDINGVGPIIEDISHRPYERWKKARKHYSNAKACRIALEIFLISLLITSWFSSGSLIHDLGTYISLESMENGFPNRLWIILIVSMVVYIVIRLTRNASFSKMCSKPPIVTLDNVDTYIGKFRQQKATEEAIRRKQEERLERLKERERQAKEQKKAEKARAAEQRKAEVANVRAAEIKVETPDKPAAETVQSAPVAQSTDMPQRSREENLFISWADALRKDGYEVLGNWDNWKNAGQWKNLAVVSSISDERLRITIEYDARSRKVYFGIAKLGDEDKVSQELLNSETFRNIITENGLTVKNNEWWYCLRFSSFDRVFSEYCELLASCRNK